MAQFEQWFEQDFTEKIEIRHCESVMFTGDDQGTVVGVHLYKDGAAYSRGGTVTGAVKRSDGGLVALTGTLSGNAASVVIPAAALAYPGPIGVHIILTQGGSTTTVLKAIYSVDDNSGAAVDPGTIIPNINDLITAINTAVASIPADYSALLHTLAPDFSASNAYFSGDYVWYNGTLYRFTANHAAGSWTGTDATAAVVGNDLSGLKSAINGDVYPFNNLASILVETDNLFDFKSPYNVDGYLNANGTIHSGSGMKTSHFIPVKPNTLYYVLGYGSSYTNARFVAEYDVNKNIVKHQSNVATSFTTEQNTRFVRFTYNSNYNESQVGLSEYPFSNRTTKPYAPIIKQSAINSGISMKRYSRAAPVSMGSSSVLNGLIGYPCSPRKGEVITFSADIDSFSAIALNLIRNGVGTKQYIVNVNASTVTITNQTGETAEYNHGLNIVNNIQINIEQNFAFSANITIVSNGSEFRQNNVRFDRKYNCYWQAQSIGSVLTNATIGWTIKDFDKPLWMFGDSYFGYSNRWTYYLNQRGYINNVLMNAYSGEGSGDAITALKVYLAVAKPRYVLWCMGMNDGTDDASTPSTVWQTNMSELIALADKHDFIPILATIPNVPAIDHRAKNEFVKSSGYQYIDFAAAVGAATSGVWYGNMLSTDGMHPTQEGALALFMEALRDCPQLMIS